MKVPKSVNNVLGYLFLPIHHIDVFVAKFAVSKSAFQELVPPPTATAAVAVAPRKSVKDGERRSEISTHPVESSPGLEIARKTPGRVKFVLVSFSSVPNSSLESSHVCGEK